MTDSVTLIGDVRRATGTVYRLGVQDGKMSVSQPVQDMQRAVDAELALLRGLPAALEPPAALSDRIRARLAIEARRQQRLARRLRTLGPLGAAAAALAIAVFGTGGPPVAPGASGLLEDWSAAIVRSQERVRSLWLDEGPDSGGDWRDTLEDFERALHALDALGA